MILAFSTSFLTFFWLCCCSISHLFAILCSAHASISQIENNVPSLFMLFSLSQRMKNSAIIVNSGRGGVINHDDLAIALKDGVVLGAGLDVTEPEPLPPDHALVGLPNCVVTPHMGSNTWDSRNSMSLTAAKCIISIFNHEKPIGLVMEA